MGLCRQVTGAGSGPCDIAPPHQTNCCLPRRRKEGSGRREGGSRGEESGERREVRGEREEGAGVRRVVRGER